MACKRLVRFFFFISLIFLSIYGGRKLLLSSIFTIKTVDIKIDGNNISNDEIKRLWNRFRKQNYSNSMPNLFKLNTNSLRRTLLSDVRIDRVGIKIYPPDKLIILIRERKPFVWIGENLGVDEKGIIFPIKGTQTLIHLSGYKEKRKGDTIPVFILFSILKIAKGYSFASMINEIRMDRKKIFLALDNNITVCIPKDIDGAYRRFKKLDAILKTEISNIRLIDLSYEDVILSP